ncbi:MAG: AbrB/MazE/SpoVT family DNA-binding domain-containing protein [Acetobacteraceae bacterium]|nr:AbrB/MazE/SpoVT family DNA-binding domain-containing protein [Acetobacteraceae bacterium]MBV8574202.1 AbrB/MazE/SpoVT family DNA-binding domain-containing protein [Acetobacteraceae bacterium]
MTRAVIDRWGKDLTVRIPTEIASTLQLHEGDRVEIKAGPDQIVIRRAKPWFALEEIFAGKPAAAWRAIYANAFDWGPDVGREYLLIPRSYSGGGENGVSL